MLTGRQKIVKANGAEPDEFEAMVAQELLNLEVCFYFLTILDNVPDLPNILSIGVYH
jgi:hypothetical protein